MPCADTLEPVAEDLWIWHAYDPRVKTELFSTLIRVPAGLVVVDPVDLAEPALVAIRAMGPVVAVVLTNGNHGRASARYRQRFGAPVLAHAEALGELECPVDGSLRAGTPVGGCLEFVELSGAGLGEVALYDPRGRLHVGDALVNLDSTGFAPLPDKYCVDGARLRRSLQKLRDVPFDSMTFAHGLPLLGEARRRLDRMIESLPGEAQGA